MVLQLLKCWMMAKQSDENINFSMVLFRFFYIIAQPAWLPFKSISIIIAHLGNKNKNQKQNKGQICNPTYSYCVYVWTCRSISWTMSRETLEFLYSSVCVFVCMLCTSVYLIFVCCTNSLIIFSNDCAASQKKEKKEA